MLYKQYINNPPFSVFKDKPKRLPKLKKQSTRHTAARAHLNFLAQDFEDHVQYAKPQVAKFEAFDKKYYQDKLKKQEQDIAELRALLNK
jgi:hypothetical protein